MWSGTDSVHIHDDVYLVMVANVGFMKMAISLICISYMYTRGRRRLCCGASLFLILRDLDLDLHMVVVHPSHLRAQKPHPK